MIKKVSLLTVLSVTAFSGWAQENSSSPNSSSEKNTDDVVVTANRFAQPVSSVLAPTTVVTREEIDRWQAKSLNDVMRRLPGVDIAENGGRGQLGSVFIRGGSASHVLVLIDGVRMASSGVTGSVDFSQIPMSLVQRIEYIRGPRSAVYGSDAIGGVINIITERAQDGGVLNAGYGSHAYQNYDGSVRGHVSDNTVVSVAGSYEATHGYNVYPSSSLPIDRDNDGYRSKSFWGALEQRFSESTSGFFRAYGYDNNTDYDAVFSGSSDKRYLNTRNYDAGLKFNEGIYSSQLTASYQTYDDLNFNDATGKYNGTITQIEQRNLQWGNVFSVGNGSLSLGADWRNERADAGGMSAYTNAQSRDNTGVYLTTQQQFGSVTLEGAVRGDDNQQYGRHGTWQTGAAWEFVEGYRIVGTYGTAFKAPTFDKIYDTAYSQGNPNLSPEESKQWEIGLEGLSGPVNWRLSGYRNEVDNLINYRAITPMLGTYDNIGKAVMTGAEFTAAYDTWWLSHQMTLEYLDAKDKTADKSLARRAHKKAKYELSTTLENNVNVSLTWLYQGARSDTNFDVFPSQPVKLGGYSTWDLAASYPITSHLTVRGRIANLFDKDYETAYGYRTAGREYYLTGSYTF
ncbi:TonB-dependent vitamin B12 receptor BtuB [Pectobacterium versatile]|uniref:TonB-dependent vitamin B12 receptor BtuB n=1 Tax=Pectobacterium versatile TaxID=2488639 RepID=UPI000D60A904|nr:MULTISPECIES: TonB-dependent vitamin B12 receptor BtuB [Pectobacterium]MBA0165647.1 TonB-dependent vitamin B12 receptor BtuB [Pectobacterium versatile]MBD0847299.1 vitamin B12/cobalamin outer membrane transporter [Pectobacterium carotovorum subsp. carotovorum]MBK4828040.1 Vitamin B12 transporter BtuB [Pectobacterium carotovorum subsp. carotovorum]MBN3062443.1 TonB-dependent vitamin B12 receptor BtuB [Pectobacterium versatile]PWD64228.1 vitamin B12/cobalamin outer membrane transporter [Pecto